MAHSEQVKLHEPNPEQIEIGRYLEEYESGKYVNLLVLVKGAKEEALFNTAEGKFESEEAAAKIKDRKYQVNYDESNGLIEVRDEEDIAVFTANLKKDEAFKRTDEIRFIWSNTERYLLISGSRNDELLIDLEEKRKVKLPINDILSIDWSADDSISVFERFPEGESRKYPTFIWNLEQNSVIDLGEFSDASYFWAPDGNYVFQWRTLVGQEIVSRYSLEEQSWSVVHETDKSIRDDTFRVLNDNQFIYVGSAMNDTDDPGEAFLRPNEHFAVKVDTAKEKVYQKQLDTNVLRVAFWNFDSKILYYQDTTGFYKADVDF